MLEKGANMVQEKMILESGYYNNDTLEKLNIYKDEAQWSRNIRKNALDLFETVSWPTTRIEEWRRTDISAIDFEAYPLDVEPEDSEWRALKNKEDFIILGNSFCAKTLL